MTIAAATDPWLSPSAVIIAHRGASGEYPENTLLAFEQAIVQKAAAIEFDVYAVNDQLFVFHDETLERLTGQKGFFDQLTVKEVTNVKIQGTHAIPKLEEVLDLLSAHPNVGINIELKGAGTAQPVSRMIQKYVSDRGFNPKRFLISSFRHNELMQFSALSPAIKLGALLCGLPVDGPDFAKKLNSFSVHMSCDCVDKAFIEDAHRLNLKVYVYTVNDKDVFDRMVLWGADGIFTDYPLRFLTGN